MVLNLTQKKKLLLFQSKYMLLVWQKLNRNLKIKAFPKCDITIIGQIESIKGISSFSLCFPMANSGKLWDDS